MLGWLLVLFVLVDGFTGVAGVLICEGDVAVFEVLVCDGFGLVEFVVAIVEPVCLGVVVEVVLTPRTAFVLAVVLYERLRCSLGCWWFMSAMPPMKTAVMVVRLIDAVLRFSNFMVSPLS